MGNAGILRQSWVNGFKLFFLSHMITSELWIMIILKWEDCKSKVWAFDKTNVSTLALGSRPRQGLTKVRAKNEAKESHFMFSRV